MIFRLWYLFNKTPKPSITDTPDLGALRASIWKRTLNFDNQYWTWTDRDKAQKNIFTSEIVNDSYVWYAVNYSYEETIMKIVIVVRRKFFIRCYIPIPKNVGKVVSL